MPSFEEFTLLLSDDYRAYARYWEPKNPTAAVLYHGGIQSHCGWFEQSASRLRDAGFSVLQFDRRGTGRNKLDRGHADSAEFDVSHAARSHSGGRGAAQRHSSWPSIPLRSPHAEFSRTRGGDFRRTGTHRATRL